MFKEENAAIRAVADIPVLENAAYIFAQLLQEGAVKKMLIPFLWDCRKLRR